jgi:hypothetical protein
MAIQFSTLLEQAGISPKLVWLLRHQDKRGGKGKTPYQLWRAQDGSLERYQQIQGKDVFKPGQWLASFVATPLGETLFTGLYYVESVGVVPVGVLDPISGLDVSGLVEYGIHPVEALSEYAGKLTIDWGSGFLAWKQRGTSPNKPIVEIRRVAIEPPFPGMLQFSWSIRHLDTVPAGWRSALSSISGIYVLASETTGKLYVGSAYGTGGFWARWENYFRTGHGGNEGMKLAADHQYQVSILEVASSSVSEKDIIRMEALWKDKLLSRKHGLNKN